MANSHICVTINLGGIVMNSKLLKSSINYLQSQFSTLNWIYHDFLNNDKTEKMYYWPGNIAEEIIICVPKSNCEQELFHRHDFFYFNYTYKGNYDSLSYNYNNKITIYEKELYAGQPFAGHALCVHDPQETIIIGVLIQKDTFFRSFLPMLSSNSKLFRFFLDPVTEKFTEEFLHFKIEDDDIIRTLLEIMVIEYAQKKEDTQMLLKPLVLYFLIQIARQYNLINSEPISTKLSDKLVQYIGTHSDTITLQCLAEYFSYHPNYISTLLQKEIGKSFSRILLEYRMERAAVLLKGTTLSIEKIALMLGYSNSSNFYKAFKNYYHLSPREYHK